ELQKKNESLKSQFRLGGWPRYDYDVLAGTLIFSDSGIPKVIAEIQIVGSTSRKAGNWLWAWGNSHWPEYRVADSKLVRAFGDQNGICELTHDFLEDDDVNALGWELTAAMVRVTDALGAYRPPRDEGGGLFLTYKSMVWAT